MKINQLYVESKVQPLGIDQEKPALSWKFSESEERSEYQSAYRVLVSSDLKLLESDVADIWDSQKTESQQSVHVIYDGSPLQSKTRYYWKVQVWDQNGTVCESNPSYWETGLFNSNDWTAKWISRQDLGDDDGSKWMPQFRHEFTAQQPIEQARAYISGLGQYELRLNGQKVSEDVLQPGWTHFDKTVLYNVYDITEGLRNGANAIGVMLGNGFYNVPGGRYRKFTGSYGKPTFRLQLEIVYTDGSHETIISNDNWLASLSPITFSCIYGGEDYDASLEQDGWDLPGFSADPSYWTNAVLAESPKGKLKFQMSPPLQVKQTFQPQQVSEPKPGVYVIDLGQNFSGWTKITVKAQKGASITCIPGERLNEDGTVSQKFTGRPSYFKYIAKGDEQETWHPRFTYTGFRYVQIEDAVPDIDSMRVPATFIGDQDISQSEAILLQIEGQMIYPDFEPTGTFESSNQMINRIHEIINWAILSNTKSVFTDCPHREKLGWLEQVHLVGPGVMYNYPVEDLYTKVMDDIRDAQTPEGMVPTTAPEYVVFDDQWRMFRDSVAWGATYIIAPWMIYEKYGNTRLLQDHYPTMRKYMDYLASCSDQHIIGHGLGDWYDVGEEGPGFSQLTPVPLAETAIYYYLSSVMKRISSLLNHHDDVNHFSQLSKEIKIAFNEQFYHPDTQHYGTNSQTSNAMPLAFGLVDDDARDTVFDHLINDIKNNDLHTTTGDVGHRFFLMTLSMFNRQDIIYKMTQKTDHPSYGYQIEHGATTLTEAWDGPTVGKSQNHFMLGHIEEWFYKELGGFDYFYNSLTDSFTLTIKPKPVENLKWAKVEHELPVGKAVVHWNRKSAEQLQLDVTVPVNSSAIVHIPARSIKDVTEHGEALKQDDNGIAVHQYENGCAVIQIGSGRYQFISNL